MDEAISLYKQGYSTSEIAKKLSLPFGERQLQRRLKALGVTRGIKVLKRCSGCKEEKQRSEFYPSKARADGYHNYCKVCESKRIRGRREQLKAYRVKRFNTDPEWRKKYSSRHEPDKVKDNCRGRTRYAVRAGKIKKLGCVVCGVADTVPHHPSYEDHMTVIWFCQLHHRRYHLGEIQL